MLHNADATVENEEEDKTLKELESKASVAFHFLLTTLFIQNSE